MPARIRELIQPNRTSNFAKVNKVNSSNRSPVHVLSRKTWLQVQAAVDDVDPSVDAQDWWERHMEDLPHWSTAFKLVLLVQPSSAAAERVFSLLQNSFSQRQSSSLEDYIETSLMLQYNR